MAPGQEANSDICFCFFFLFVCCFFVVFFFFNFPHNNCMLSVLIRSASMRQL